MSTHSKPSPVLAIHGGAGTILRSKISPEQEARYLAALHAILVAGQRMLAEGAAALDVAVEAVRLLEECELFNAGKGAVYTEAGTHELDATVMDGRDLNGGAVAGLKTTRNPVLAARAVMERSAHLMFIGEAADAFARDCSLEQVAPTWFGTPARLEQLARVQASSAGVMLDHDSR